MATLHVSIWDGVAHFSLLFIQGEVTFISRMIPELSMAFIQKEGKVKGKWLPVTPSTALGADSLVTFTSGKLVAATAGTAAVDLIGVLVKAIASTDSDYASDRLVEVLVPEEKHVLWEADVTSGLVATDVGAEVDLTDASTINRAAGSVDVAKVIRRISATKGLFWLKLNGSY